MAGEGLAGAAVAGAGVESRLEYRLKRLMFFRVVMITTLLLIAAYVELVSNTLPINPLYTLIAATYALTIVYALAIRWAPYREIQAYAQFFFDLVTITGLVYYTGDGGTRVGFTLLYPISVLSGSVLLFRRTGLILATAATGLYAWMLGGVRAGWLPDQSMNELSLMPPKQIAYSIFVVGTSCVTVALIGSYLSQNLKDVGQRLEEAAEQVADLRGLNEIIVNSIHSGLLTANAAGQVVHMNAFGEIILGQRVADIRGQRVSEVFASDLLEATALTAREGLAGLTRIEISYERPDGRRLELGVSTSPLARPYPSESGHLLVFQDLTDIKRLEQEVRIKEKLAAVGEMAAYLAHEIRNPLGSISGSAQVLMGEPNISVEQERLLDIIRRESKRLSDSVEQFLHEARPRGRALEPVDLGPLVSEAVTLLRNDREISPRHRVEFKTDPGAYVCMADRDQILQVFWNLVRNGIEAMPDGGVLDVAVRREASDVILSVKDQGRGMAHEEQRRMFEPFQSSMPKGTGLGLAIVYRIVREHHGDIGVRSVPAQGTVVEVRLPLLTVPNAGGTRA
jgi:two-component system sensor histidine kinase PilS (NtrC family)